MSLCLEKLEAYLDRDPLSGAFTPARIYFLLSSRGVISLASTWGELVGKR